MTYESIMEALAIPMTPLRAPSITYALIILGIALIALLLAWGLLRAGTRQENVIFLCGVILLLSECVKQTLLSCVRGSYSWSDLPWQLCSIPMYLCLIYPLLKAGAKQSVRDFLSSFGLIGAIAAFALPWGSFYRYALLTGQSLLWHGILLFLGIYCLMADRQTGKKRPLTAFLPAMGIYLVCALIALGLDLGLYEISGGSCNLFFIGPAYPDVVILNELHEALGPVPESAIMITVTELSALGVHALERKIMKT